MLRLDIHHNPRVALAQQKLVPQKTSGMRFGAQPSNPKGVSQTGWGVTSKGIETLKWLGKLAAWLLAGLGLGQLVGRIFSPKPIATTPSPAALRTLFPEIEPYNTFRLKVSGLHELYVEESGNPKGQPVVFLHGGPGAGTSPRQRRFFDPQFYRIILLDQRGSGQSTPRGCIQENTTWDLVNDLETLRTQLNLDQWLVFGGSFGSLLALAYAETHPERVSGLILRGISLGRPQDTAWSNTAGGLDRVFPDAWKILEEPIPPAERGDMLEAYFKLLTHPAIDEQTKLRAARAYNLSSGMTAKLQAAAPAPPTPESDKEDLDMALISCHYYKNNAFMQDPEQLLTHLDQIQHIPTRIIQGRYDMNTPAHRAFLLKERLPQATLTIVPNAGHSAWEPGTLHHLIEATEAFKSILPATTAQK